MRVLLHKVTKIHLYEYALRVLHTCLYYIRLYMPIIYMHGERSGGGGADGGWGGGTCQKVNMLFTYTIHVFLFEGCILYIYILYTYSIHAFEGFVQYMYTYTYSIHAFEGFVLYTTVCMHICYNIVQHMMSYSGVEPPYSLLLTRNTTKLINPLGSNSKLKR